MTPEIVTYSRDKELKQARRREKMREYAREYYRRNKSKVKAKQRRAYARRKSQPTEVYRLTVGPKLTLWERLRLSYTAVKYIFSLPA